MSHAYEGTNVRWSEDEAGRFIGLRNAGSPLNDM